MIWIMEIEWLFNQKNKFIYLENVKFKGILFRIFALSENKTELFNEKQT